MGLFMGDDAKVIVQRCEGEGAKVRRCEGAVAKERYYYRFFAFMELTISFNDNYSYKYGVCGKNSPIRKVYILLILHGIGYMYVEATSQSHVYWISCILGMLMA